MINQFYCLSPILCEDLLNQIKSFMSNPCTLHYEHCENHYNMIKNLINNEFNQMFITWQFQNCCCHYAITEICKYNPKQFKLDSFICSIKRDCPEYAILKGGKDILMTIGCISPEKWRLLTTLDKSAYSSFI